MCATSCRHAASMLQACGKCFDCASAGADVDPDFCAVADGDKSCRRRLHLRTNDRDQSRNGAANGAGETCYRSIVLLLFLQKQNLATAIYLFGLGTLLTGLGLKHMRIRSHHDLAGALVTSLFLGRPWWSTTSPTCLPLSVFTITSDQHRCRIPPLL